VLVPSEERFVRCELVPAVRLRPDAGTGSMVGVAGLEGVAMELVVAVLPADSLELGRRPPSMVLWNRTLDLADVGVGDIEEEELRVDDVEGSELRGLDALRRSVFRGGEGEPSMMRTQPEESPGEVLCPPSLELSED
jgi:hypothetical protein